MNGEEFNKKKNNSFIHIRKVHVLMKYSLGIFLDCIDMYWYPFTWRQFKLISRALDVQRNLHVLPQFISSDFLGKNWNQVASQLFLILTGMATEVFQIKFRFDKNFWKKLDLFFWKDFRPRARKHDFGTLNARVIF
jgi:hypothetical protein